MDFNKFDSRAQAEIGSPMQVMDPWSGEPMMAEDGKPCIVIVRGTASKTMQAKMRAKAKAAMQSKKDKGKVEDEEARVMEDVHLQLVESAAPFIVGFENIDNGNRPATAEDAEWFLDLSFPEMGEKKDADGNVITKKAQKVGADGNPMFDPANRPVMEDVPEYEMINNPFAKQVGEFASKQANRLGNGKRG
jgi:hypothetical protein